MADEPSQGQAPATETPATTETAQAPAGPIFTQDQVNSILRDRVGALNTKHETALSELTAKLAALEQSTSEGDTPPGKKPEKDIEARMEAVVAPIRAKLEEAEAENEKLHMEQRETIRDDALRAELAKAKAINPDQCCALLRGSVSLPGDNKQITVMDAEGNPRFGPLGKAMTTEAYVAEFLTANTHFLPVSTNPGSGAMGGNGELPAVTGAIVYNKSPELGTG